MAETDGPCGIVWSKDFRFASASRELNITLADILNRYSDRLSEFSSTTYVWCSRAHYL